jgi:hypothetical protein
MGVEWSVNANDRTHNDVESEPMTVRLANEIRETSMPVRCAACFNQQPALRHIDFDAACDRGYGNQETVQVSMDELVLCENCVKVGGELLGMTPENEKTIQINELERKLDVERKRREKAERYADTLEDAIGQRPDPIHLDHRKKPRRTAEELIA